jgi:hypothetical protein
VLLPDPVFAAIEAHRAAYSAYAAIRGLGAVWGHDDIAELLETARGRGRGGAREVSNEQEA